MVTHLECGRLELILYLLIYLHPGNLQIFIEDVFGEKLDLVVVAEGGVFQLGFGFVQGVEVAAASEEQAAFVRVVL